MNGRFRRFICFTAVAAALLILAGAGAGAYSYGDDYDDRIVVVSLGDSYSSGEGIEPFYGQQASSINEKVKISDWLAHRSSKSWPALLTVGGSRTMGTYKSDAGQYGSYVWYFAAVSGATTANLTAPQIKTVKVAEVSFWGLKFRKLGDFSLSPQLSVFNGMYGVADYVTITLGGNDVCFADIIQTCVMNSTYLGSHALENQLNGLWKQIPQTKAKLKEAYTSIRRAAGEQATIIVAGYPKLLDRGGKGIAISKKEAELVNDSVTRFNLVIKGIVDDCRASGMDIYYVDVETEFDRDGGHQAYSKNSWINPVYLGSKAQDLDASAIASSYSVHPNELGAQAYARCVNAKIKEIEAAKRAAH
ncbi:MAG: SGNH/GDSL hydrolase family protein [Clostridia bacterium]|nr:SGNH/GDSL hydrolase family protein [Clostridia bacterium]